MPRRGFRAARRNLWSGDMRGECFGIRMGESETRSKREPCGSSSPHEQELNRGHGGMRLLKVEMKEV